MLTVVAAVTSAAIALSGLARSEKSQNGKLSRPGLATAVLILILGAVTVGAAVYQTQITREKEAQEKKDEAAKSDRQSRQFYSEMAGLRATANSLRYLQRGLSQVTTDQRALLVHATDNLATSRRLQAITERANAIMIRRMFDLSDRVLASDVHDIMELSCPQGKDGREHKLELWTSWVDVTLNGAHSKIIRINRDPRAAEVGSLGPLSVLHGWRDAIISFHGEYSPPGIKMLEEVADLDSSTYEPNYPSGCRVSATLIVNDHVLARSTGPLTRTGDAAFVADFPNIKVDNAAIPSLGSFMRSDVAER